MKSWKDILVGPDVSIRETVGVIDGGSLQIALVVDKDRRLLGTVTDGDVRRGLLRGVALDEAVGMIMNRNPTIGALEEDRETLLAVMRAKKLRRVPIVDAAGSVVGLEVFDDLVAPRARNSVVVLMAGGLGSRLRPLTEDCPKPMLKIGSRPILETILYNFIEYGFRRFYVSVNYKAEMIMNHFGDGKAWDVNIRYLQESDQLGTAGALGLLPEKPSEPFIVMNGDLLTRVNFDHLLDFHAEHRSIATMCVREYVIQVPYGVTTLDGYHIRAIEEKPTHRFFVNAGIYVLEPGVLDSVPKGQALDMPALFETLIAKKRVVSAFPLREYWLDIGRQTDLELANGDFASHFD